MRLKIISILIFLFLLIPTTSMSEEKRNMYPNMLMYNSTASCIQGVIGLLLENNPKLRGQMLPPPILQQMIGHCSCVMDRIRLKFPVEDYYANMHDYIWIRETWGKYGRECIDMGYLAGLVIKDDKPSDNQTIDKPKSILESPKPIEPEPEPEPPKIQEPEENINDSATTFQG